MANLTLVIDDEVLKQARIRALEQGTSVNAIVRDHLSRYAGGSRQQRARARLLELSEKTHAGSGKRGRRWTREDLYEARSGRQRR